MGTREKTWRVTVAAVCAALTTLTACGAAAGDMFARSTAGEPLMRTIAGGDPPGAECGREQARLRDLLDLFGKFKWDEGYDYKRERSRS